MENCLIIQEVTRALCVSHSTIERACMSNFKLCSIPLFSVVDVRIIVYIMKVIYSSYYVYC